MWEWMLSACVDTGVVYNGIRIYCWEIDNSLLYIDSVSITALATKEVLIEAIKEAVRRKIIGWSDEEIYEYDLHSP